MLIIEPVLPWSRLIVSRAELAGIVVAIFLVMYIEKGHLFTSVLFLCIQMTVYKARITQQILLQLLQQVLLLLEQL